MHTDLVYQKENPSKQHLKILCRERNVWIDVMGILSTGIEDNWIGGHALNRSGPQPRSRIPEETYIDTQGGHFSATEAVTRRQRFLHERGGVPSNGKRAIRHNTWKQIPVFEGNL